ncbi:ribonucleotide reductase subunit alpha [Phenylobacterium kunshanense]|uniref:Ribonucleotide reductase subunit alpha n=1 Tax=Phenylobacterium kunshanense TaxID=1445034 RepID=A0A328BGX5_9CAUL|nr:ribonucleotide reductase subunit alpha [Phenylobacterium kunshanense]RAK66500.1 ribonucleotide reductase subunit alpha [Phenylobacterium kunshanense]
MVETSHFQQLLSAAAAQPQPQRLLFTFATVELPDDATVQQRERFLAGRGGAVAPLMCVDKAPDEIADFEALVAESRRAGPPWQMVFAASLSGVDDRPPSKAEIETALQAMVDAVRLGAVGRFAAYDASGEHLHFG